MIAIISPAQNMNHTARSGIVMTVPQFQDKALELANHLMAYAPWQLEGLLRVNADIALRAFDYYQEFQDLKNQAPALLSYHGLAYSNIAPDSLSTDELHYAQDHLRVLSALYGILRPLDGMQPHRLDFMGKFKVDGQNLYKYWQNQVCRSLFESGQPVVNLCSEEYSKLIRPHLKPWDHMISCRFLILRKNKYVCLATEAKMARGKMVRYIIQNRIEEPDRLKQFTTNGYRYDKSLSTPDDMVFLQEG